MNSLYTQLSQNNYAFNFIRYAVFNVSVVTILIPSVTLSYTDILTRTKCVLLVTVSSRFLCCKISIVQELRIYHW